MSRQYMSWDDAEESQMNAWYWLHSYFKEEMMNDPATQAEYKAAYAKAVAEGLEDPEEAALEEAHSGLDEMADSDLDYVVRNIVSGNLNWTVPRDKASEFARAVIQYNEASAWLEANEQYRSEPTEPIEHLYA